MCARQIANGHPRLFLQETRFAVASVTMNTPHHHNGILYMQKRHVKGVAP